MWPWIAMYYAESFVQANFLGQDWDIVEKRLRRVWLDLVKEEIYVNTQKWLNITEKYPLNHTKYISSLA